jgi:RimJ/RimL family protein N-acetyltransferase
MHLRPAIASDAALLFRWRNDPTTRAMSKTSRPVEWDEHVAWLERRLGRETPDLYIAEVEAEAVGVVRIDGADLSYTVAPEHRGRGHATAMLTLVRKRFGPLRAEIKPENLASIRAASRAGHAVVLLR